MAVAYASALFHVVLWFGSTGRLSARLASADVESSANGKPWAAKQRASWRPASVANARPSSSSRPLLGVVRHSGVVGGEASATAEGAARPDGEGTSEDNGGSFRSEKVRLRPS